MTIESENYEDRSYPIPSFGNYQASTSSLQYQIDTKAIIEDIERNLLGVEPKINEQTGMIEYKSIEGVKPVVSAAAVKRAMIILKSRLNQIFVLSDLDDEIINNEVFITGKILIEDMFYNWKDYTIDKSGAKILLHTVCDTVHATLRKARGAKYLQFLGTTHTMNEVQHVQSKANEKKPNFIDRLLNK